MFLETLEATQFREDLVESAYCACCSAVYTFITNANLFDLKIYWPNREDNFFFKELVAWKFENDDVNDVDFEMVA